MSEEQPYTLQRARDGIYAAVLYPTGREKVLELLRQHGAKDLLTMEVQFLEHFTDELEGLIRTLRLIVPLSVKFAIGDRLKTPYGTIGTVIKYEVRYHLLLDGSGTHSTGWSEADLRAIGEIA